MGNLLWVLFIYGSLYESDRGTSTFGWHVDPC